MEDQRQANRAFKEIKQAFDKNDQMHRELFHEIEKIQKSQQLMGQIRSLEARKQLLNTIFSGASLYSNVIILAGYAGLFTLWGFVRPYLESGEVLLTGTMMLISVTLFALFEIIKMIGYSLQVRNLSQFIRGRPDEGTLWQAAQEVHQARFYRIWAWFLIPTLISGLGAGLVLLFTMSSHLVDLAG